MKTFKTFLTESDSFTDLGYRTPEQMAQAKEDRKKKKLAKDAEAHLPAPQVDHPDAVIKQSDKDAIRAIVKRQREIANKTKAAK